MTAPGHVREARLFSSCEIKRNKKRALEGRKGRRNCRGCKDKPENSKEGAYIASEVRAGEPRMEIRHLN
jgi:hypothetical protein